VHTNIASHSVDFEAVLTVGIYLVKITAEVLSKILRAHEGLQLEFKEDCSHLVPSGSGRSQRVALGGYKNW
jgi:hypothetical protein